MDSSTIGNTNKNTAYNQDYNQDYYQNTNSSSLNNNRPYNDNNSNYSNQSYKNGSNNINSNNGLRNNNYDDDEINRKLGASQNSNIDTANDSSFKEKLGYENHPGLNKEFKNSKNEERYPGSSSIDPNSVYCQTTKGDGYDNSYGSFDDDKFTNSNQTPYNKQLDNHANDIGTKYSNGNNKPSVDGIKRTERYVKNDSSNIENDYNSGYNNNYDNNYQNTASNDYENTPYSNNSKPSKVSGMMEKTKGKIEHTLGKVTKNDKMINKGLDHKYNGEAEIEAAKYQNSTEY